MKRDLCGLEILYGVFEGYLEEPYPSFVIPLW